MLGDEPPVVVEGLVQHGSGQRTGHPTECVNAGDCRELVVALIEQLGKHVDGVECTIGPAGEKLERLGRSESSDNAGCVDDAVARIDQDTLVAHQMVEFETALDATHELHRRGPCLADGVAGQAGHQVEHP